MARHDPQQKKDMGSDSASLHLCMAPQMAMTSVQDNDTPALNALKALRGAPISMGRGETPVGGCQPPSGFANNNLQMRRKLS